MYYKNLSTQQIIFLIRIINPNHSYTKITYTYHIFNDTLYILHIIKITIFSQQIRHINKND